MLIFRIGIGILLFLYSFSYAQIKVKPGEISTLEVEIQKTLIAGDEYNIKIKATDRFGNPSNNFGSAATLNIKSDGLNITNPVITPKDIVDGVFYLKVYPSKVGEYKISALLGEKQVSFKIKPSDTTSPFLSFRVINGKADNVVISSSDSFIPGYRYNIRFLFYDKEGNPVTEKEHLNQILTITAEKFSKEINIKDISGYQYEIELTPMSITNFDITVLDNLSQKKLGLKTVKPEIQTVDRFEIELPQEIEAGVPFKVRIKALDNTGRLIKIYDKIGKDVKLLSTGSGQLIPDTIPREYFKDGIAEIDVIYTKSELINIYASVSSGREPITTIKPYTEPGKKEEKVTKTEPERETVSSQQKKEKITENKQASQNEQIKPQKQEKTSIKLRFPSEIGLLSKVVEINKDKDSLLIKGIFENRNPDYDIKKFENDIMIKGKKVGTISFYEDKDRNLLISLKMQDDGYKISYTLQPKNLLEINIEKVK